LGNVSNHFAVRVKSREQIVGHVSREMSSEVLGIEGKQLVTSLEEGSKEMDWNYMLCRKAVAYK